MTLYEALDEFQTRYLSVLSSSSRRVSDPIATDWQKISNEYNLYFQAVGQGLYVTGETHLDNIIAILNGYNIIVDEPVQTPLPLSIYGSPALILVPVDFLGLNPNFTNANSTVYVYMGGVDDSSNWTYNITGTTNVTANISGGNQVNITAITADNGSVTIEVSKTNYGTLTFVILVNKYYDANDGVSLNIYPEEIPIPTDPFGVPTSYATAYADVIIFLGNVDDTSNWNISINTVTNVTANITGGNRVNITNITADTGSVDILSTKSGFSDLNNTIQVYKRYAAEDGLSLNTYPDTIVIPCDSSGTPLSYAQAYSDVIIRFGDTDDTSNWTISINTATNVTANISGGNRLNITVISADEGSVDLQCTRSGYSTLNVTVFVQKQLQGQAVVDGSSVDNITVELNISDEIQLKDDGITTGKINISTFDWPGGLEKYNIDGTDYVYVPTVARRAPGTGNNLEGSHGIGFGEQNIVLGNGSIIGPLSNATTYKVQTYNPANDRIYLAVSEGDVSASFTASDKILVWNEEGESTVSGFDDNARYYIGGTIVSATFDSTQTYITITEDFTVNNHVVDYIFDVVSSTDTMVCASYDPSIGSPNPRYRNTIIGNNNRINGSQNLVIGGGWSVLQGPFDVTVGTGNILIGGGTTDTVLGDANMFLVRKTGNLIPITHHEDSQYNIAIGSGLSIGVSTDVVERSLNHVFGTDLTTTSNGSLILGTSGRSYTNGEIVIAGGDTKRRKVMYQLSRRTTATTNVELQTYYEATSFGAYYVTPENVQVIQDSVLSFVIDLTGVQVSSGNVYRRRLIGTVKNDGGVITLIGGAVTEDANYSVSEFTPTSYTVSASSGELIVQVQPASTTATEWLGWVEGQIVEF